MRKTWLIFINSIQRMRLVFATSLAVGILLCVLLVLFTTLTPTFNASVSLGYTDNDETALSADFARYATQNLDIELVKGDESYLNSELVEKHISAIVEVPAGFEQAVLNGKDGALQVTYMDDYLNKVFLQSYLEMYTGSVDMLALAAQGDVGRLAELLDTASAQAAPVTTVSLDSEQAQRYQQWTSFTVGLGFFVFIAGMLISVLATVIYEDKANNTFKRVQATNVSALAYITGVCSAGFISIIIMVIVYLVFCAMSGLNAVVGLVEVGVLSALFVLFCVGFALACGLFSKSRNSIIWVSLAVSTICSLLGGAWFPLEYSPQFMQDLAHFTPQFWFIDAVYRMQGGQPDAWIVSAAVLALFALLCFLIAGIRFATNKSAPH